MNKLLYGLIIVTAFVMQHYELLIVIPIMAWVFQDTNKKRKRKKSPKISIMPQF